MDFHGVKMPFGGNGWMGKSTLNDINQDCHWCRFEYCIGIDNFGQQR